MRIEITKMQKLQKTQLSTLGTTIIIMSISFYFAIPKSRNIQWSYRIFLGKHLTLTLCDLDLDLSRSLKVESNGTVGPHVWFPINV